MGENEEMCGPFNHIIGDMKSMGPLWEDMFIKASKFYGAMKQTAITADAFLDSFQKISDATSGSKGATRDIGICLGKIVFRHKQIEFKLRTFVSVMADSFLAPLQEAVDDWKKTASLLEKDHAKDYKRVKGDLKKANAEVAKLKKKASKKIGKQEYTDQFREAMRVANNICKALEEQERSYLEKLMIEERTRTSQFFNFYKPVMDMEMTLISEIEKLGDLMTLTSEKCSKPTELPESAKDLITDLKVPDYLRPGNRETSSASPPASPIAVKDRSLSVSSSSSRGSLTRSQTLPSNYSKGGLDPVPYSVPVVLSGGPASISSSRSSFSSSSSLDHTANVPVFDPVTLEEINGGVSTNGHHHHHNVTNDLGQIDEYMTHREDPSNIIHHKTLKTRTSWSSIETTDSSGIGSHNSLNSNHLRSGHSSTTTLPNNYCHSNSSNESEGIEPDFHECGPGVDHQPVNYPPPPDFNMPMKYGNDVSNKYATIDRSHFRRNQRLTSSLRDQAAGLNKQRSNSFGENENPLFPEYKMNLPKNKMNTICSRTAYTAATNNANNGIGSNHHHHQHQQQQQQYSRPSIYNMFDQNAAELRKKLSPTGSPVKKPPPPTMPRRNSTQGAPPATAAKPKSPHRQLSLHSAVGYPPPTSEPKAFTEDNEPDDITPGSFQDALNQRRLTMRKKSFVRAATEGSNV